jgi:hypothetical protein
MGIQSVRLNVAFAFFAAAAAWPVAVHAISYSLMTPMQRALRASWCGGDPRALEYLQHCQVCWSASAVCLLAGALVLSAQRPLCDLREAA